jgi:hypothetical protein
MMLEPEPDTQIDLFAWARELEQEKERIAKVNDERARRRGYLVFATDPAVSPEDPNYCEIYATEARTPNQAAGKIRPLSPRPTGPVASRRAARSQLVGSP